MATVNLSPLFNGWQGMLANGQPNNSGFINSYQAGSSTPLATYTTSIGNIQNNLSIPLGVSGLPPNEIWLVQGSAYKFVVMDSLSNVLGTYDNITGINDASYPNLIAYLSALTTTWAISTTGNAATATLATNATNWLGSGSVSNAANLYNEQNSGGF